MSFRSDLDAWRRKVEADRDAIFVNSVSLAKEAIVEGSPITGSPGQPVQTGNLKTSWQEELIGNEAATISTNVEYAPAIEDGIGPHGPMTVRSQMGGFHSVKLLIAGWWAIVQQAVAQTVRP